MTSLSIIEPALGEDGITPVVLFDDSQYRVHLIAYLRRSEGRFMLKTYRKKHGGLELVISRSVALDESGARILLDALRSHLMPHETVSRGACFVVKTKIDGIESDEHDPKRIAKALSELLADRRIAKHLADRELGATLRESLTGAIRIFELRSALDTLRNYLEEGIAEERIYQKWCEEHTWAFGNAYVVRDSERRISMGDIADLLLPTVLTGYREIIELKRPDVEILKYDKDHNNYYFSPDASRAIGQCHRYVDRLHEEASRGMKDKPHIIAYHPRAIIVMGRSIDWDDDQNRALHCLNRGMHHITIMTYDQLLRQGERALQIIDYKRESFSPLDLEDSDPELTIAEHAGPPSFIDTH